MNKIKIIFSPAANSVSLVTEKLVITSVREGKKQKVTTKTNKNRRRIV